MIILICGPSHIGKTRLAQELLEKYKYTYISIDHLKMGLIRSEQTSLSTEDDLGLTPYLWNIVKEMIKTAIENKQNMIVEGVYIPFNFKDSFDSFYLKDIKYLFLAFSSSYIDKHYSDIVSNACCIEKRIDEEYLTISFLKKENASFIEGCKMEGLDYLEIKDNYLEEIEEYLKVRLK